MLDLSHIPNSQQDVRIFYAISGSNSWQTWQKPRKCNYVWIMCIGGGGGGAAGYTNPILSGQNTGGGGGGISRALYNAQQLPDSLYVQVGVGGAGGDPSISVAQAGTRSLVALQPVVAAQNQVCISGNVAAVGGIQNSGGGSSGETASTQATATFYTLSNFLSTAGQSSTGGTVGQPTNVTPLTSQITCPGGSSSGRTTVFNGASILSSSISPLIAGGTLATASGSSGGNGGNGITSWKPFFSLGGAGGGSS